MYLRHITTPRYRAPELMLRPNGHYDTSVDMWSVGCILGELIGRKPMFPGKDFIHQLRLIFDVIGAPRQDEVTHIENEDVSKSFNGNAIGITVHTKS